MSNLIRIGNEDKRAYNEFFDPARLREEWSAEPADLAEWANRATRMLALAERFHVTLTEIQEALLNGKP